MNEFPTDLLKVWVSLGSSGFETFRRFLLARPTRSFFLKVAIIDGKIIRRSLADIKEVELEPAGLSIINGLILKVAPIEK